MGFGRWLKKKGSTGSIARWVGQLWVEGARRQPEMDAAELCKLILEARYVHVPLALTGPSRDYFLRIMREGKTPETPFELARFIWDVEIGVDPLCAAQCTECYEILDEELIRVGFNRNPQSSRPTN